MGALAPVIPIIATVGKVVTAVGTAVSVAKTAKDLIDPPEVEKKPKISFGLPGVSDEVSAYKRKLFVDQRARFFHTLEQKAPEYAYKLRQGPRSQTVR